MLGHPCSQRWKQVPACPRAGGTDLNQARRQAAWRSQRPPQGVAGSMSRWQESASRGERWGHGQGRPSTSQPRARRAVIRNPSASLEGSSGGGRQEQRILPSSCVVKEGGTDSRSGGACCRQSPHRGPQRVLGLPRSPTAWRLQRPPLPLLHVSREPGYRPVGREGQS